MANSSNDLADRMRAAAFDTIIYSIAEPVEIAAVPLTTALNLLREARKAGRREGLEEACKIICGWCANRYDCADVPTVPTLGATVRDTYFHGPDEQGFECYATKIRRALAADKGDADANR